MSKDNLIKKYLKIIWCFAKFQILSKGIVLLVVFPIARKILKLILSTTGRTSITSGDFKAVLFSLQGVGILCLGLFLLVLLVAFDINSFIIISAMAIKNKLDYFMKIFYKFKQE